MTKFIEVPATKRSLFTRKLAYGVGINDAAYMVYGKSNEGAQTCCPYYSSWLEMIRRSYSEEFINRNPTYKNCLVSDEWLLFTNFKRWMIDQNWKGKQLDKDIKIPGNKIYSAETCLFVTREINSLLTTSGASRGNCLIGVCWIENKQKFISSCGVRGKKHFIGLYETEIGAHEAYKKFKQRHIICIANLPENEYVREYLLNHANLLTI